MARAPHKNLTKSEYQSKNNAREELGGNFHNIEFDKGGGMCRCFSLAKPCPHCALPCTPDGLDNSALTHRDAGISPLLDCSLWFLGCCVCVGGVPWIFVEWMNVPMGIYLRDIQASGTAAWAALSATLDVRTWRPGCSGCSAFHPQLCGAGLTVQVWQILLWQLSTSSLVYQLHHHQLWAPELSAASKPIFRSRMHSLFCGVSLGTYLLNFSPFLCLFLVFLKEKKRTLKYLALSVLVSFAL